MIFGLIVLAVLVADLVMIRIISVRVARRMATQRQIDLVHDYAGAQQHAAA